ncbi:hypothetical protein EXIGLDRAFT_725725 [Exidia glandulosa HHB12029]|uniref:Protein kinase domain-containing protein n=1 Tax=Exidia glandulosa HHB12029 TaxID=1314781 RepID=A0A165Q9A3_EXIGL|nr:hypothetical protein EXIGLDRAFT_725725 [Exidia glandulosa HHB12029]
MFDAPPPEVSPSDSLLSNLPRTLFAWRTLDYREAHKAWIFLASFIAEQGYTLFKILPNDTTPPPVFTLVRSPDEYHYWPSSNVFQPEQLVPEFAPNSGIHFAARSLANQEVVIRLLTIGDEGKASLDILRRLSAPEARVARNHALPMIKELHIGDMVFGVFPMMYAHGLTSFPWPETTEQILDGLEQALEGFVYLHENLIAHRDFAFEEIFLNFGAITGSSVPWNEKLCRRVPLPIRSQFPARYYINDFELSVQFDPSSDPATRLVTGVPIARYGYTVDDYAKPLPPEARGDAPYCPFKMDVYQFGQNASEFFSGVTGVPGLHELFASMASDDPRDRPSFAQALSSLQEARRATPDHALREMSVDWSRWLRAIAKRKDCTCHTCLPSEDAKSPRQPLLDIYQFRVKSSG